MCDWASVFGARTSKGCGERFEARSLELRLQSGGPGHANRLHFGEIPLRHRHAGSSVATHGAAHHGHRHFTRCVLCRRGDGDVSRSGVGAQRDEYNCNMGRRARMRGCTTREGPVGHPRPWGKFWAPPGIVTCESLALIPSPFILTMNACASATRTWSPAVRPPPSSLTRMGSRVTRRVDAARSPTQCTH